jgi:hypothetical protein
LSSVAPENRAVFDVIEPRRRSLDHADRADFAH